MKYAEFRPEYLIGVSYSDVNATEETPAYYILSVYVKDMHPIMLTYTDKAERDADYKYVKDSLKWKE